MTSFTFRSQKNGIVDVHISDAVIEDSVPVPQMSVIHRMFFENWDGTAGAYVLVDSLPSADGKFRLYVGRSTDGGVGKRMGDHFKKPPKKMQGWTFAIVVHAQRGKDGVSDIGYEEAHALEWMLWDRLNQARYVAICNGQEPGEPKVKLSVVKKLEAFAETVVDLLKVLGVIVVSKPNSQVVSLVRDNVAADSTNGDNGNGDSGNGDSDSVKNGEDSREGNSDGKGKKYYTTKLPELIRAGEIKVGTKLVSLHPSHSCEAEIADEHGSIQILRFGYDTQSRTWKRELSGQQKYRYGNLSAATRIAIELGTMVSQANGWTFWGRASDKTPLAEIRRLYDERKKLPS